MINLSTVLHHLQKSPPYYFGRIACYNSVVWNVFCNNTASPHNNMISNSKSRKYDASDTYDSIISNICIYLYPTAMIVC